MKILYLTDQIYLHGGIEKVLSQKANYLADIFGDEVIIVTYNQQGRIPVYAFSEKIKRIDLGINYEIGTCYFHPKNLLKMPLHKKRLKEAIKQLQPDVIISSSYGPDFFFLPDIAPSIPKIKEFHGSRYLSSLSKLTYRQQLQQRKLKRAEAKYDALAVLNDDEKKFYHNRKIVVIPNPSESNAATANIASKKILAAGRISGVKNFGALIDAFAAVSHEFPDWELHFWGEDYTGTQQQLQDQINRYQLQEQIKFMGVTPNLKEEMLKYSLYGMTSETECFPMVLLEALSAGLPVISYDSPTGPKHILTHESDSFLVPYKNSAIFVERLKELMRDENLRKHMGANGKRNAQRFEIATVMQQWKNLFNELTAKP